MQMWASVRPMGELFELEQRTNTPHRVVLLPWFVKFQRGNCYCCCLVGPFVYVLSIYAASRSIPGLISSTTTSPLCRYTRSPTRCLALVSVVVLTIFGFIGTHLGGFPHQPTPQNMLVGSMQMLPSSTWPFSLGYATAYGTSC